ncbi:hypothetical protein V1478_002411 [Vespula squamosa]|uniref:Uncharacterized protein n=1 Tax=Vespula squamosa TaxID=30214 RepID=A0ABD2BX97_VESSQ
MQVLNICICRHCASYSENQDQRGTFSGFTVCQDNSICPEIHLNYTRNKYGNSDELVCFVSRNLLLVSTAKDLLEMLFNDTGLAPDRMPNEQND